MPDQEENRAPTPAQKKKSLTLVFVIVAALIGVVGLGLYFLLQPAQPASAAGTASATLPLETFVVNLSGSGDRAYLRVSISLGLSHPLPRNKEEIPIALVRDTILSVLSSARAEQLTQAEGKNKLKSDLLQALQDRVPQLGIVDVYFTEFLVQM